MTTPRPIGEILKDLGSTHWFAARDAVDQAGDFLRATHPTDAELDALAAQLVVLARHPRWQIRKAVAHAILHLRHARFEEVVAILLEDDNAYVKETAEKALARRSQVTRAALLKEEHGDQLGQLLMDIEARFGARARTMAMRAAERHTAQTFRTAYHEIVNIVTPLELTLKQIAETLTRSKIDRPAATEHTKRAQERLRLVSAVVGSLKDWTTEVTPEFRAENVRGMVEEVAGLVRDRLPAKVATRSLEIDIEPTLVVDAHRHRMVQALFNVLRNAYEAYDGLSRQGTIRVQAQVDGSSEVTLTIADDGCGMGEEALHDSTRLKFSSNKPGGMGVGLPIAKKIIESEHSGQLWVDSQRGVGTTVRIVVPLEQEHT